MNIFKLPVHPAAEVFPMLDEDELEELAADIKANGLRYPIVIGKHDKETVIVDGRNRREACKRAGVEPTTTDLNGVDPVAYILSANINRRHMTKGQRAMAVAKLYPEPQQGKRGTSFETKEVSASRISFARTVLKFALDRAELVLSGALSLDEAYREAKDRKRNTETEESRLEFLKSSHPDLAEQVIEGRLGLVVAEQEGKRRDEEARLKREAAFKAWALHFSRVAEYAEHPAQHGRMKELLDDFPEEFEKVSEMSRSNFLKTVETIAKHIDSLLGVLKS